MLWGRLSAIHHQIECNGGTTHRAGSVEAIRPVETAVRNHLSYSICGDSEQIDRSTRFRFIMSTLRGVGWGGMAQR